MKTKQNIIDMTKKVLHDNILMKCCYINAQSNNYNKIINKLLGYITLCVITIYTNF